MNLLDLTIGILKILGVGSSSSSTTGIIGYGRQRSDGGHDHRTNTGSDRTPAQRSGDKSRRK